MKKLCLFIFCLSAKIAVAQLSEIDRFYSFSFPSIPNSANTGVFLQASPSNFARIQSNNQIEQDNVWNAFYASLNLDYRLSYFYKTNHGR